MMCSERLNHTVQSSEHHWPYCFRVETPTECLGCHLESHIIHFRVTILTQLHDTYVAMNLEKFRDQTTFNEQCNNQNILVESTINELCVPLQRLIECLKYHQTLDIKQNGEDRKSFQHFIFCI